MAAEVIAVCKSEKKQTKKVNVGDACIKENYGITGSFIETKARISII